VSIAAELDGELRDAMRGRDRARMDVIRQVRTEVAKAVAAPGFHGTADDDLYREIMGAYSKRMAKAREEFLTAGERGAAQAEKLRYEVEYLSRWLPTTLSEEETRLLVRAALAELGVADAKSTGRVVGAIMKSGREGLDGALVNRLVHEELDTG